MSRKTKNAVLIMLILSVCGLIAIVAVRYIRLVEEQRQHERELAEYPVSFSEPIERYAAEYTLDPYLVLSIMRCESSFRTDAVSSAGAIGLMQIMPDSGEWIAHKLDEEPFDVSVLYDPETSIRFACWYLLFLTNRLNGDRTNIIAAYNAGHGSVEGWLKNPAYAQNGTLVSIPYPETERYVQKVNKAYEMYRKLYPELFSSGVADSPSA